MGAFGELLRVYWGDPTKAHKPQPPKELSHTEKKYEEDREEFEEGFLGLKERKILISYMGEYHTRISYNRFMTYNNWLKFTENGKFHYWEVINNIVNKHGKI